jgi:hypothetical protein
MPARPYGFVRQRLCGSRTSKGVNHTVVHIPSAPDDPEHPALLWSIAQNEDEIAALHTLLHDTRCVLHLFNEIAVNVASIEARFSFDADEIQTLLTDARILHNLEDPNDMRDRVSAILDDVHRGTIRPSAGRSLVASISQPRQEIRSHYYTNSLAASQLSIFHTDDGAQQEALALWLTDTLTTEGAHVNPTVTHRIQGT